MIAPELEGRADELERAGLSDDRYGSPLPKTEARPDQEAAPRAPWPRRGLLRLTCRNRFRFALRNILVLPGFL